MAKQEIKTQTIEREYVIPLRKEWMKVPRYKRTARSVKAIKKFIVRHMNIRDGDTNKVKLDIYLNNELWFRGVKNPVNKIKVRAKKEGDIVRVELVSVPNEIRFSRLRQEKRHKRIEKKEKVEEKKEGLEEKVETEKSDGEKKEEGEKEKSVEQANIKLAEQAAKAQKHTMKGKGPQVQRKALKK